MRNLIQNTLRLMTISAVVMLQSCNSNNDNNPVIPQGTSTVKVMMADAPGDYDAVFIDVREVRIKGTLDGNDDNWTPLNNITPGIYDLLELTGGVTATLAEQQIPSGYLGQIRIVLGPNNTIVKNGITLPLNTPSAQQSGLKVKIDQLLLPGVTYNFLLDFDVDKSIVEAGNSGNYNLKPVIRASAIAVSGAIRGNIALLTPDPVLVSLTVNGEIISAYTNANGDFYLYGVPSGTYDLSVTPAPLSGFVAFTIPGVAVVNGQVTNTGIITI